MEPYNRRLRRKGWNKTGHSQGHQNWGKGGGEGGGGGGKGEGEGEGIKSQTRKKNSPKLLQLTPIMCVPSLLSGIKKLNKLILAKSKKFTLAVSSNVRFVFSADINHSYQRQGLDINFPYWWEWQDNNSKLTSHCTSSTVVSDESLLARYRWVSATRVLVLAAM